MNDIFAQKRFWIVWLACLTACLQPLQTLAQTGNAERILSFHSDITINSNASMEVVETIEVYANGRNIRRGIFRDFPTRYQDRFGNDIVVQFEVLEVKRNGRVEAWRVASRSNGKRVYIGSEDRQLPPGNYRYTIRYRTDRQLGYFDDHDELYWNVTGNGWDFYINQASATIQLPGDVAASQIEISGYTGRFGASGTNYTARIESGRVLIETTAALARREGLTVAVSWPKGHVFEPSDVDRIRYLLVDNRGLLLAVLALLASLIFLTVTWARIGRDPEPGIVFPRYAPPGDHSPASAHYLSKMAYSSKTFSAALINLAVKGHVKIVETGLGFTLRKLPSTEAIASGEALLMKRLFKSDPSIELLDDNYKIIGKAQSAHAKELARRYKNIFFKTNSWWLLITGAASLIALAFVVLWGGVTPLVIGVFVVNGILHVLFFNLLKARTARGRALLDDLEGFELYLSVAEKTDLELAHPPEKTPELFERFLPYALALGVENEWADQFAALFDSMRDGGNNGYRPGWYVGPAPMGNIAKFSDSLGSSLSSAVSSSATPPGSSSGSGGGGFSGGGGGGGW